MTKLKVKKIFETDFDLIISFLQNNFSSPTHWPDWNSVVSKFYKTDFFYFCAYEDDELVGLCPVHKVKKGLITDYNSGQFHFIPFGGWIYSKEIEIESDDLQIGGFSSFQSFCLPSLPEFGTIIKNNNGRNFKTLIIDLSKDLDLIWNNDVDSKRRNMVRKAEKNNVIIDKNPLDFASFYKIYKQASIRCNLDLLDENYFKELFYGSKNIGFEIITAKKEDVILSNVAIVYDKSYSIYWLGNNTDDIPNLGQGELLQWEAIKRMKDRGCSYYDLCYIEKERLPHIYKFKSGFSKNEVNVSLVNTRKTPYRIMNRITGWF